MILTKERIETVKKNGNGGLTSFSQQLTNNYNILFFLENLGYLPENFDSEIILPFLKNESQKIRLWTVKNLGKINNEELIPILLKVAKTDEGSMVRREAVSSIGRMRNPKAKDVLIELLQNPDPKILLQAIRGLLVFKNDKDVTEKLKALIKHPNEMVQTVIEKEFFSNNQSKSRKPHPASPDYLKNVVVNGDTIETMKLIPDESIHLTFTSPPYYNARDYSTYPSYKAYLEFLVKVFKEVHRITKEGRFFILNTSPIIIPRVSRQHSSKRYPIPYDIHPYLIEMEWEFIDDIVWVKPEASVKNRNAGFLQHRKPLGYKPNTVTECLMVYRKKTTKLLDWNIRQYDWKTVKESKIEGDYETRNVWNIDPCFDRVHSAVFPIKLCGRVIKFYSFKGDLVFDPFAGSGTFGKAAKLLDRYFFLTELDKTYFTRIEGNLNGKTIFEDREPKFLTFQEFAKMVEK